MKQKLLSLEKVLLVAGCLALPTARCEAQDVKAANITSVSDDEKAAAVNVTLTGRLTSTNNGDFRQLRDLCYQMETLTLTTATCTAIPDNALHSRHALKRVTLPNKLLTIGSQAFFACDALSGTLTIPANVNSIGASAFNGCSSISALQIPSSSSLQNIGSYAFAGCTSLSGTLAIPEKIRVLRDGVFTNCSSIEALTLPKNLQRIGANAFAGCTSLSGEIAMERMLVEIGPSAFAGCAKLNAVSMPRALLQLGESAFAGCTALSGRITLPASLQELGAGAFNGCASLEEIVLPESITQVGAATFAGCTSLKALYAYAATPPAADATAFAGVSTQGVELYVPAGSEQAYAEATVWKDFKISTLSAISNVNSGQVPTPTIEGSNVWVKNLPQASCVKMWNDRGQLIATLHAEGDVSISLPQTGIYVVTVNGKNFKLKY